MAMAGERYVFPPLYRLHIEFPSHLESFVDERDERDIIRVYAVKHLSLHPAFRNDDVPRIPKDDGSPEKKCSTWTRREASGIDAH